MSARALSQPRLADGTPYVGELGKLSYDPDEDRVQCHLCGGWYRILGGAHLRRTHGWTLAEYRDAFQLPMQLPACSHAFSQHQSVLATSLIARGGNFGKGTGVSPERHSRVRPWRSLGAAHPELVAELDPERNEDLGDPSAIGAHSSRRLWWRCAACNHRWQATVGSRSSGHGCPECYNQRRRNQGPRTAPAERSLQALRPDLTAEWDRAENGEVDPASVTPGSKHKVWWRCATCGQRWQASVQNRVSGHGCPACGVKRRARTQGRVGYDRSLAANYPELIPELHAAQNPGLDPEKVAARSSLKVWWRCATCGHEWRAAVASRTAAGTGCPVCGLKRRYAWRRRSSTRGRRVAQLHQSLRVERAPSCLGSIPGLRSGCSSAATAGSRTASDRAGGTRLWVRARRLRLPRLLSSKPGQGRSRLGRPVVLRSTTLDNSIYVHQQR